MALARKALTLEEFLRLPEEKPALEYMDGVVSQKVSPKGKHGMLQYSLAERINTAAKTTGIAVALPEVRITFGGKSPVPDVSVYRWERLPLDAANEIADDLRTPPDVAIEILSPGQSLSGTAERCQWYVNHGVEIAMLIDPRRRVVRAFHADGQNDEWRGADHIDITSVVPDFVLTVDELFGALRVPRPPAG